MSCYHTRPAWRSRQLTADRRPGVTFSINDAWKDLPLDLPCGKCIGCRLQKAAEWGLRVMHETRNHQASAFVTLTYDDAQLPADLSLNPHHLDLLWKAYRRQGHTIRYFACGEYGPQTNRPHYHAVVFGWWPQHRVQLPRSGIPMFRSDELDKLWNRGHAAFSAVTQENATYVAKYTLDKFDDNGQLKDYSGRTAPFLRMSTHPGIGQNYAREHARALARFQGVRLRGGALAAVPRYYEKVLDRHEPQLAQGLRRKKQEKARQTQLDKRTDDPTPADRETVTKSRVATTRSQH